MAARTIKDQHPARRDDIGDLVTRRPLPGPRLDHLDPFLFLNHHGPQIYPANNRGLPFGPHPHRGFETVTFILAGDLMHRDSGGHESVITAGGIQWMTAGRGLVHAELSSPEFLRAGGPLEILQLWINLPARLKMTEPRYVGLQRGEIPVIVEDDGRAHIQLAAGSRGGVSGAFRSITGVTMTTIDFKRSGRASFDVPREDNVFLYVVRGALEIAGARVEAHRLVEMNHEGDGVEMRAVDDAFVLFGHRAAFGDPIVAHGPFVMNTKREIVEAIADFQAGKFGDVP